MTTDTLGDLLAAWIVRDFGPDVELGAPTADTLAEGRDNFRRDYDVPGLEYIDAELFTATVVPGVLVRCPKFGPRTYYPSAHAVANARRVLEAQS